jgi:flagellar basal-body rod protein FlgG
MLDALTASQAGMLNDIQSMHAISHNLANVSTAGFKREMTIARPFVEHLSLATTNGDSSYAQFKVTLPQLEMFTDHRAGALKLTSNPLDLALEDDGFFAVMGDSGPVYTRQGNFSLDAQGRLVTVSGLPVQGNGGDIRLTTPNPVIDQDGNIYEGDQLVARLQVVKLSNPEQLISLGNGLYGTGEGLVPEQPGLLRVRQGYLEMPNVVMTDEMIHMIETMRHFESSQRVLKSYDSMLDRAINIIGEF